MPNDNEPQFTKMDVLKLMPCDNEDRHFTGCIAPDDNVIVVTTEADLLQKAKDDLPCAGCRFAGRICQATSHVFDRSAKGHRIAVIGTPQMNFEAAIKYLEEEAAK